MHNFFSFSFPFITIFSFKMHKPSKHECSCSTRIFWNSVLPVCSSKKIYTTYIQHTYNNNIGAAYSCKKVSRNTLLCVILLNLPAARWYKSFFLSFTYWFTYSSLFIFTCMYSCMRLTWFNHFPLFGFSWWTTKSRSIYSPSMFFMVI